VQTGRRAFIIGAAAAATTVAVGGYSTLIEPFWPEVTHVPLPLPHAPARWRGRTICQISDLHICERIRISYLRECFHRVTALQPDLVAITGDFITLEPGAFEGLQQLQSHFPRGRLATVAILGNHDYSSGRGGGWTNDGCAAQVVANVERAGVTLLRNSALAVDGLKIVGTDDLWAGRFDPRAALANVGPGEPALVLAHNPDCVDLPGWGDYRGWILSGHTHGGQCKPPFLPPPLLPVSNRRYTAGRFELSGGRTLYINRGLGYLRQVRFNVRPEITMFTVV
jgi:predicted MPP superfamily phosphohydrolase